MADPIKISLSAFQQARLAAFKQDAAALQARLNDTIWAMIAHDIDPATVQGWNIQQVGAEIVCTPPPEQTGPTGPKLVPDIGPDGVSESAASA